MQKCWKNVPKCRVWALQHHKATICPSIVEEETVPKKIYLDLKSTNCDDYFCTVTTCAASSCPGLGSSLDNVEVNVYRELETSCCSPNNNNPLLSGLCVCVCVVFAFKYWATCDVQNFVFDHVTHKQ